jgi:pyroglutamyl-peptidase
MKKILITGFNAFGRMRVNPSELVVAKLNEGAKPARHRARKYELLTALLPTEYSRATAQMKQLLRREKPDAVLCLGVAAGRKEICLERFALNLDDEALADNAGVVRRDRLIAGNGPPLYRSTLPLAKLLKDLQRRGLRSRISNHAGTYLCNHIFYVVRHQTAARDIPAGFIHLPPLKTKRTAGMALAGMVRAMNRCVDVVAKELM